MKTTILFLGLIWITVLTGTEVAQANQAQSETPQTCTVRGRFKGWLTGGVTGWEAANASSLEECIEAAQVKIGHRFQFLNRDVEITSAEFQFQDGKRKIQGKVSLN